MMDWPFSTYTIFILCGGIISGALSVSAWRRRPETGAMTFTLMMVGVTVWSLANALEMATINLPVKILWAKVEYLGIVTIPVTWLCFALQYTGREKWLTRRNLALLVTIPMITLTLVWLNETHGLIWRDIKLETSGAFPVLGLTHGGWFWIYIVYSYLVLLLGTLAFIHALIHSPRIFHGQTRALLVGLLAPWVGNFLYISGLNPFPPLDLTLFGFIITGLALTWGLFYHRILDIIPVARNVVMEYMSDGVIILDHKNRVIDFNAAAQSLFGCKLPESIGQPVIDVLSNIPILAECCKNKSVERTELILPVEGEQRILDLRVSLFRDRWGKQRGKLMIWRDITEKKEAEIRIQKSEERHRAVTQLANDAIVVMDTHCRVISWNKKAQKMFGYKEEEILGQPVTQLIPVHYRQMHQEGAERLCSGGEPHVIGKNKALEFSGLKKDGSQFPLELSLASWEAGGKAFSSAIIRDITARKQAEAAQRQYAVELEAQNAELDAFAHTVAHDLKKPLTELTGFCSLLKIHFAETLTKDHKGYLKKIEKSAFKMGNIVDELLLLASVRDMREVNINTLLMGDIVAEAQIRLENMIQEYHADIVLPKKWPVAKGYGPWIEEVWINYFSNAIKYGGQPPRIQAGAIQEERQVRFWVQDNGNGLSIEAQKRLFTSFERLHQVSVEGHGLGLSIVQRIIAKLGGQTGVESKEGKGSIFYFTLPI